MRRFSEKVVVVTGAACGIGRGIAAGFSREGAVVCGFDRDAQGLDSAALELKSAGGSFHSSVVDVSSASDIAIAIASVIEQFGRIDVLVNNAGINMNKRIAELEIADWDQTLDTNLKSMFMLCKAVWPHMTKQRGGVILNMASVMGQVGGISAPAYCSSKAGIIMLSRCLAKDGAAVGIRVNSICPGYIDTPIMERLLATYPDPAAMRRDIVSRQPLGRLGTPDDIANGALFLASPEASFVSGIELTIDGAVTATQID